MFGVLTVRRCLSCLTALLSTASRTLEPDSRWWWRGIYKYIFINI